MQSLEDIDINLGSPGKCDERDATISTEKGVGPRRTASSLVTAPAPRDWHKKTKRSRPIQENREAKTGGVNTNVQTPISNPQIITIGG